MHPFATSFYLLKVNNRSNRKRCEIFSKLTIKTPEWRQWCCCGHFIVDFENTLHLFSSVFIVEFGQVNVCSILIMVFSNKGFSYSVFVASVNDWLYVVFGRLDWPMMRRNNIIWELITKILSWLFHNTYIFHVKPWKTYNISSFMLKTEVSVLSFQFSVSNTVDSL